MDPPRTAAAAAAPSSSPLPEVEAAAASSRPARRASPPLALSIVPATRRLSVAGLGWQRFGSRAGCAGVQGEELLAAAGAACARFRLRRPPMACVQGPGRGPEAHARLPVRASSSRPLQAAACSPNSPTGRQACSRPNYPTRYGCGLWRPPSSLHAAPTDILFWGNHPDLSKQKMHQQAATAVEAVVEAPGFRTVRSPSPVQGLEGLPAHPLDPLCALEYEQARGWVAGPAGLQE